MGVKNNRTVTKTRRKIRDLDQIKADLTVEKHLALYHQTKTAEDLPALGKWYCIECAHWYDSEANMKAHTRGRPHRRRVKQLREEPYTQKEAEAAIGLRTDNTGPRRQDASDDADMMS